MLDAIPDISPEVLNTQVELHLREDADDRTKQFIQETAKDHPMMIGLLKPLKKIQDPLDVMIALKTIMIILRCLNAQLEVNQLETEPKDK